MTKKIPFILCIDVEPDSRLIEQKKGEPWTGYEAMHSLLKGMRTKFETATDAPVHYSWFYRVDPQIARSYETADWALQYYKEWIRVYQEAGDEIGLHPHAYRLDKKGWIADHGNQLWVEHCLDVAFEGFQRNLGFPCRSFRFGDRWMNQETSDYLQQAGVQYDLTLEPGYKAQKKMLLNSNERATGSLPDTTRMPKFPYRAKAGQYQAPEAFAREGMWIIPVSTGAFQLSFGRKELLFRKIFQHASTQPFTATLNLCFNPKLIARVLESLLYQEIVPCLTLTVRTDAGVRPVLRRNLEANLEILLNHPLREKFIFCTPAEAIDVLGYEGKKSNRIEAETCVVS